MILVVVQDGRTYMSKNQMSRPKVVGVNCPLPPERNRVNISSSFLGGGEPLTHPVPTAPRSNCAICLYIIAKKKYAAGFVTVNFEMVCIICTKDI